MLKLLKEIDQFGAVFQPKIKYSRESHKTYCGGLMSIMLYGLCLTYLVYLCYQWQNGSILPQITALQIIKPDNKLQLNETYIQIHLRKYGHSEIDPFDPQAMIMQPVLYIYKNGVHNATPLKVPYTVEQEEGEFNVINIQNISIEISENEDDENPEIEYLLGFGDCMQELLIDGEQCANDTIVEQFYSQYTNLMVVKQYVKEFSTTTQQLETIPRESYIPIQENITYFARTYAQTALTSVDVGFLFEEWSVYEHITEYRLVTAVIDYEFFHDLFNHHMPLVFFYSIDDVQLEQIVTYSKLSEILAQAGSIASTILVLSYIIIILNQSKLSFQAINKVISMYYPEFKDLKIKRNLLGKIRYVEKNGKQIDLPSFKETYERLSKIGEIKLTISNQIYEISRIQFLLQALIQKQQIRQVHKKGLPLQLNYLEAQNDENQSVDLSMAQEFRFKRNTILPSNEGGSKVQTLQVLESKSNSTQKDLHAPILDQLLTDNDFEMLMIPNDSIQKIQGYGKQQQN